MNYIISENKKIYPSKIVCVGRNYVEHIRELNNEIPENMVLFNKPNSAINEELYFFEDVRFEGEICFMVENKSLKYIGFGLDLTNAKIQNYLKQKSLPWERAKAFNKSAIFSEFVKFDMNFEDLKMEVYFNEELRQIATYELMIYKPNEILKEILSFMDLEDGDIIMTGTPKGVGFYKKGDIIEAKIYHKNELLINKKFKAL